MAVPDHLHRFVKSHGGVHALERSKPYLLDCVIGAALSQPTAIELRWVFGAESSIILIMPTPSKRLYQRAREKHPGVVRYPLVTRKAGILVAMAFELPGSIVGGLVIGYLLDHYFKTSPWLMMALTTLGFTAACIRLVRWAKFFSDKRNETNVPDADHSAQ